MTETTEAQIEKSNGWNNTDWSNDRNDWKMIEMTKIITERTDMTGITKKLTEKKRK